MTPFTTLPPTAATHFRLHFFGAALRLREHAPEDRFPFLADYCGDADHAGVGTAAAWEAAVTAWEAPLALPLTRLASAAELGPEGIRALFLVGLVNEDARFGAVFEHFTGHARPTSGLLHAWWPSLRPSLRRLAELGLTEATDTESVLVNAPLQVPPVVWDAVRGVAPGKLVPWARYRAPEALTRVEDLLLPAPLHDAVGRLPAVLASGAAGAVVVRGPATGGRRTVLGAVARSCGWGALEVSGLTAGDARWRALGSLATLLGALPVVVLDVPPGETVEVPAPDGWDGPLAVVLGRRGGVSGPALERAVTLRLELPGPAERARHWAAALGLAAPAGELAARFRMTGGNIRRTAALGQAEAALAGRDRPTLADLAGGARTLHGRLLDTLAAPVPTARDWSRVAVRPETMRELLLLEARCRNRERIRQFIGTAAAAELSVGVRALLTGPSGTGKTLAARTLAGVLGMDLYRIDLSAVVNKYLGETEKSLNRLFSNAEEADAALLLDEGDALMTRRTDVQSSNDRYANLETNFLLQRLESFEGILLVTTNGGDRIDDAFRRRMDAAIDFGLPNEPERWSIWRLHLPDDHRVPDDLLAELSVRCALTGGQMRNAVLHASLLALEAGASMTSEHLEAAVRREYANAGQVCPLGARVGVG
jgi:hypothetical protein